MQKPTFKEGILTNGTLSYNGLMVHQLLVLFLFSVILGPVKAQDERYYRQMLGGVLPKLMETPPQESFHQFNVFGTNYRVDLDADGVDEVIEPQKRDGVDWLEIRRVSGKRIYETKLFATGGESTLYKIKIAHLSTNARVLILFLDEGKTQGKKFESTARIFLVSYDNNDLSTLKMTPGPHFFHEFEGQREQYYRRDYSVNVWDLDKDGMREISVEFNHIQRIMKYKGKGEWERF